MFLKSLTIEQYRGFVSHTLIELHPSFTLIVGENGTGKTSVLWALRVLLSHTLAKLVKKSGNILLFHPKDISRGWPYLRVEVANATRLSVTRSEKVEDGDTWLHTRITLKPVNPDFQPIELTGSEEGELQVVAELVEVLGDKS